MIIITKLHLSDARHLYNVQIAALSKAKRRLNELHKTLKCVKKDSPLKVYQAYKVHTTRLRKAAQEWVATCKHNRHLAHIAYDDLCKQEALQSMQSNRRKLIETTLQSLSFEQQTVLKEYWRLGQ